MVFLVLLLLLHGEPTDGFSCAPNLARTVLPSDFSSRTVCWARKARNKSKKRKGGSPASRGGGFGAVKPAPGPAAVMDDYAVFPRLEPHVAGTLVPSIPELMSADKAPETLPDEIYERLEQIYGLSDFNYVAKEKESTPMSLTDMLSSSPSATETTTTPSSSSSSFGDLLGATSSSAAATSVGSSDLDSLLASATGGVVSPGTSSKSPTSQQQQQQQTAAEAQQPLALDRLPPFEKVRILHIDPLVVSVEDFFTAEECDRYVQMSSTKVNPNGVMESRSPTVGKDATAKAQRTSTTWYHMFRNVPELMAKASRLLGIDTIDRWEEPQTVRYRRNEKFTWHLDALGPDENKAQMGGQRTATLLVYLTELDEAEGGATMFRDLGGENEGEEGDSKPLRVQPKKGSALLFFPAAGGIPNVPFDIRTLHCGEVVSDEAKNDKWIAQLWLREKTYSATAPPGNNHKNALEAIEAYCAAAAGS